MNALLWGLQVLLALHTAVGAVWKTINSEQTVPSLAAMPHAMWLALAAMEAVCTLALLAPVVTRRFARVVPVAALVITAEMLGFSVVNLASSAPDTGSVIYWVVVAALSAAVGIGRLRRPA